MLPGCNNTAAPAASAAAAMLKQGPPVAQNQNGSHSQRHMQARQPTAQPHFKSAQTASACAPSGAASPITAGTARSGPGLHSRVIPAAMPGSARAVGMAGLAACASRGPPSKSHNLLRPTADRPTRPPHPPLPFLAADSHLHLHRRRCPSPQPQAQAATAGAVASGTSAHAAVARQPLRGGEPLFAQPADYAEGRAPPTAAAYLAAPAPATAAARPGSAPDGQLRRRQQKDTAASKLLNTSPAHKSSSTSSLQPSAQMASQPSSRLPQRSQPPAATTQQQHQRSGGQTKQHRSSTTSWRPAAASRKSLAASSADRSSRTPSSGPSSLNIGLSAKHDAADRPGSRGQLHHPRPRVQEKGQAEARRAPTAALAPTPAAASASKRSTSPAPASNLAVPTPTAPAAQSFRPVNSPTDKQAGGRRLPDSPAPAASRALSPGRHEDGRLSPLRVVSPAVEPPSNIAGPNAEGQSEAASLDEAAPATYEHWLALAASSPMRSRSPLSPYTLQQYEALPFSLEEKMSRFATSLTLPAAGDVDSNVNDNSGMGNPGNTSRAELFWVLGQDMAS